MAPRGSVASIPLTLSTTDEVEANEADVLEQMAAVSEDEDYPRSEEPE